MVWIGPIRFGETRLVDHHFPNAGILETLAGALRVLAHEAQDAEGTDAFLGSLLAFRETEDAKELASIVKGKKTCILLGKGIMLDRPKSVMAAAWNLLTLTRSPRGLILLLDANTQGIYELNPLLDSWGSPKKAKAYYVTSGNAHVPPEAEFLVLQDIFESKMLERADVVLPGTGLPEEQGTIVSMESRVQAISQIARAPGTSMADWRIVASLSALLGGTGFGYVDAEQVTQEMFSTSPIQGLGLMVKPLPAMRLFPVEADAPSEQAPISSRPVHPYRGADLVDKVDDLYRLYKYRGVVE